MSQPRDGDWLPALERWCAAPVSVVRRTPLLGGYASGGVTGIDLEVAGRAVSVALKRGSATEIAAMRALAVVPGVDRPHLIAAGRDGVGHWLLTPHYEGGPLDAGADVPDPLWETLARVHAHWFRRRPPGLPVVDARWWRALCQERVRPAVEAAADRFPGAAPASAAAAVHEWATDPRMSAALSLLPKTMVHGDAHRGNILHGPDGVTMIDWGNAKVAPGGLDLAVLRAQGSPVPEHYRKLLADNGAQCEPRLLEVERHWADVHVHVAYLGFAADHLGPHRVGEMIDAASTSLVRLGNALSDVR